MGRQALGDDVRCRQRRWGIVLVTVLGLGLGIDVQCSRAAGDSFRDPEAVRETMRRGDTIVVALERFRARTGGYPSSLSQLVPDDLAAIPEPTAGRPWWWYAGDRRSFGLSFGMSLPVVTGLHDHLYPCYARSSGAEGWMIDQ